MRWLGGFILIIGFLLISAYIGIKGYPYRLYSQWVSGQDWDKYFSIPNYKKQWLVPIPSSPISKYDEDYSQLWKQFPLRNLLIPLPVRHPLYKTIPYLEKIKGNKSPNLGFSIISSAGRELIHLYSIPSYFLSDYSSGQEFFKLPFIRNRILKMTPNDVWKETFSRVIKIESKTLDEMILDLYVLHLRSKLIPSRAKSYSILKNGIAIIELESNDKDFSVELISELQSGKVSGYLIKTEINNEDSLNLRSKFLNSIVINPEDQGIIDFLYKEFKQLNFARQIDQEGMLYLFTAWSQNTSNTELFREMIYYLEKGGQSKLQLRPLYKYALDNFGKTFSTKSDFNKNDDQNITLQRKIEIEKNETLKKIQVEKEAIPEKPDMTPEEKMNSYLKKAKENSSKKNNEMLVH